MTSSLQNFKKNRGDPNASQGVNDFSPFVQAVENLFNALGGPLNQFSPGQIIDPAKLKQGGAASGDWVAWDGADWAKATPPAVTINVISDVLLVASQATISFSSIPGTFKNLMLEAYMRCDRSTPAPDDLQIRFNADSGTNYDSYSYEANGTGPSQTGNQSLGAAQIVWLNTIPSTGEEAAGVFSPAKFFIPHYVGAANNKNIHGRIHFKRGTSTGEMHVNQVMGSWRSNNAITVIDLALANGSNFVSGSRFTLYGY